MTVDLEHDWRSKDTESFQVIPKLLNLFDDHNVKATFFVVGEICEHHEQVIKEISSKHEIASHSHTHVNLSKLDVAEVEDEIVRSKKEIESLGLKCLGFRAPRYQPHPKLGQLLVKHGFKYDSSISSFFPGRYMNLMSPTRPYKASEENLSKKGDGIVELPVPNFTIFKFPSAGLFYYRFFYPMSKLFFRRPYMFYLHPHEFFSGKAAKGVYGGMYKRNLGDSAWKIFEEYVQKENIGFTSCEEFVKAKFPDLF